MPTGACKETSSSVCELAGGHSQGAESRCATAECPLAGDCNGDGRVDLADASHFLSCFTGADGGPVSDRCWCADFDLDGDVDKADWRSFKIAYHRQ